MGKEFAFLKKVGFPIDIKKIFKSKEYVNDNNYDIWFKINLKILKNANKTL
jgi:asparagine synthase (glutamine-hydrolysing)